VVKDGRTFVRRLIDSLSNVNNRNAKILLSSEFFDDIAWWVKFMNMFNGTDVLMTIPKMLNFEMVPRFCSS
jgi:hypothetical protein